MRILAVTDSYPPYHSGGYELRCKDILDILESHGHDVRIITNRSPSGECIPRHEEGRIFRVFHRQDSSRSLIRGIIDDYRDVTYLDKNIRSFEPDVVYLGHIINLTRAMLPCLAETGIPIVIDEGGKSVSWSFTHRGPWYGLIGCKSNSAVKDWLKYLLGFGVSKLCRNRLKREWIWPDNIRAYFNSRSALEHTLNEGMFLIDSQVIHSGVDTDQFAFVDHEIADGHIEITVPGRIEPLKGTKDAIFLLNYLWRKNVRANLTIVGKLSSTMYCNELVDQIESLGLQELVTIAQQVEYHYMPLYYRQAHICFFPSYQRIGLSRVPLEAMACGCLVFTYGNEGSDEIIRDKETGFIVPQGNFEAIFKIIQELAKDRNRYQKIIHNARKCVEENHSMDLYVDKIELFLQKAVNVSRTKNGN